MSHPPGPPAGPPPGPPAGPPPGPSAGPPAGFAPIPPTNNKATAALITGVTTLVLSWCCGLGVLGVVAVVLGVRGRAEVRASHGTQTGDGLAVAGIITGAIAVVIGVAVIALIILVVATGSAAFTGTTYDA